MRIKVLRNLGPEFTRYKEGQVVEASDDEAERLIARKLAELTDDEVTDINDLQAVPRAAEIGRSKPELGSVERATEDLKEYKERAGRKTATAAPATTENIGKNPHEPTK